MTANQALILFLAAFWGALVAAVKIANWREGKRWSDGPSLIPVVPFIPLVAGGLGWLINWFATPWGTWAIGAIHVRYLVILLVGLRRRQKRLSADDADASGRDESDAR